MESTISEIQHKIERETYSNNDFNERIIIKGNLLKIAYHKYEWFQDIENPEDFIKYLKTIRPRSDIFSFWQRIPYTEPMYDQYTMKSDDIAVLPISTFDNWWKKQISAKTRNAVRKAEKNNVAIKIVEFNDDLVKSISTIFNETPIRQGRPFLHYNKPVSVVKEEMSRELEISTFLSAEYEGKMIGFVKLLFCDRYTMMVEILSMIKHRNKSPQNALIAKAVEICAVRKSPFMVYSKWVEGSLGDFKRNNGFTKMCLPRYYVPLSFWGNIALKYSLQNGVKSIVPKSIITGLKILRRKMLTKLKGVNK